MPEDVGRLAYLVGIPVDIYHEVTRCEVCSFIESIEYSIDSSWGSSCMMDDDIFTSIFPLALFGRRWECLFEWKHSVKIRDIYRKDEVFWSV